ncbi:MAG TPA: hypothetical protein VGH19_08540 [Verrucomicrobiae bacterium]
MLNRFLFTLLAGFWLTMSYLLWKSEIRGRFQPGNEIPVNLVFEKILTSPDNSNMEIRRRGKRIGYVRWSASIGEETATGRRSSLDAPIGMVKQMSSYTIDADGGLTALESGQHFKFFTSMKFATNFAWEDFSIRLNQRPFTAEMRTIATEKTATFRLSDTITDWEQTVPLEDLKNPKKLVVKFGGPIVGNAVGMLMEEGVAKARRTTSEIKWRAYNDWLRVGYAQFRIYRLRATLGEGQEIVVSVSRVGEILKVELPNEMVLVNDELRQ